MALQHQTSTMSKIELLSILKTLGIRSLMAGDLDDFIAQAEKETWTPLTLLEQFVKKELRERESRSLKLRQQESKIGAFTSMASFDWAWPKKIDRLLIESLLTAEFVESGDNVVLIGSHGLGKSLIAKNLIHQAVLKGHTALFVEASQMLTDLSSKDSARILEQRLKHYTRPDLLCIDEVGYLSYDQRAADFLFQIISRRYEKKSVIITTNLAFNDWATFFPGATSVVSLVDRLIHHSYVTLIEGDSYRKRFAEERKSEQKLKRKPK